MGVILTIALVVLVVAVALWFLRRAWWLGRPSRSSHSAGSDPEGSLTLPLDGHVGGRSIHGSSLTVLVHSALASRARCAVARAV